jgi:signal transduction histidine kinase
MSVGAPLRAIGHIVVHFSFEALGSFDQINLGSTFLQAVVTLSFAGVQIGVARHFDRPAMRALSKLWLLLAIATIPNILSSWVGVVGYKELSRAFNTVVIALLAAGIPYVRLATDALASAKPPVRDTRRDAIAWALAALLLHGVSVFGSAALFPDARVVTVTASRLIKLAVIAVPAQIAWNAYARADRHKRAIRLLAFGFSALAIRQAVSVTLGLRVGMPDLPFGAVVTAITIEVLAIICFGVMSLLTNSAEELAVVQQQSATLVAAEARIASGERMESLGVAHDFNNLLQVIKLTTGSLRHPGERRDDAIALDGIQDATRHGAALVSQLLTFARQQPQDPQRFDAVDRLRTLSPMLRRVAGPSVECEVTVADGAAIVLLDPAQFEQIAINLVSNARDAVGREGRVAVTLDVLTVGADDPRTGTVDAGEYVRLTVADNGHGIPADIRGRIFEPFFTTKEDGHGAGLGLAMVHGIVRGAGGNVTVDSTPQRGATFAVYLPVLDRTPSSKPEGPRSGRAPTPPVGLVAVG